MKNGRRVIFGQNRTNQNPLNEVLWGHQDVETVATILHAGLQNLYEKKNQDNKWKK